MASAPATPQAIELGLFLKRLRNRAGLSQQTVADQLRISHSDVSRREGGKQGLDETRLGAHLNAVHASDDEIEQAIRIHASVLNPNWLAAGVDRQVAVLAEYESAAKRIVNGQPSNIPGPLQTRAWMLETLRRRGHSLEEAGKLANFREARGRQILEGGVRFDAYIGEHALRYSRCSDDVTVEQLRHLQTVGVLPGVSVRAVPLKKRDSPLWAGAFVLIELAESKVVHLEHLETSMMLTDERYVRGYATAADTLHAEAMSPDATRGLIAQVIDEMEST